MVVVSRTDGSLTLRLELEKTVEYILDEMTHEGVRLLGDEKWNVFINHGDFRESLRTALIDYGRWHGPKAIGRYVVGIALMRGMRCGRMHDGERLLCSDERVNTAVDPNCTCKHIGVLAADTLTACVNTFQQVMERINAQADRPSHA